MAPTLIVFLGGFGASEVEDMVDGVRIDASLNAMNTWREAFPDSDVVIVTNADNHDFLGDYIIDRDTKEFHFGLRLAEVIRKHEIDSAVYMGGGSVGLLTSDDFFDVGSRIKKGFAVTNNLFSSDLVGFPVNDRVLQVVSEVDRDNSLARALKDRAGLEVQGLDRNVRTQFDIDTPTDVCILLLTGVLKWGPPLEPAHEEWMLSRYNAVLPFFLDVTKQIVVAGRVGTQAWSYLERETACRVRLFAEERGMEADGRAASGKARSLLGYYIDAVGLERFFETLAELGDAAFIDTRVLLAHKRVEASREDRFLSDLGRWQDIGDPFLRDFTRLALEAPIPVLLGGHSLMAGGLMALNEYAWRTLGDD